MSGEVIEKAAWRFFFDGISRVLDGQRAEVEVASLGLGHQIAAEWAPILGFSYDDKDDIISVAVGGLDHLISRPQAVSARLRGAAVESLAITDCAGTLHIVRFREPLLLPPPQPSGSGSPAPRGPVAV